MDGWVRFLRERCADGPRKALKLNPTLTDEQVLVVSDEVYEYMVYADGKTGINGYHGPNPKLARIFEDSGKASGVEHGAEKPPSDVVAEGSAGKTLDHIHFSTLEGMWDRTITISSAGKTFSVTGWQVIAVRSFVGRRGVGGIPGLCSLLLSRSLGQTSAEQYRCPEPFAMRSIARCRAVRAPLRGCCARQGAAALAVSSGTCHCVSRLVVSREEPDAPVLHGSM